jgi:hypothetical protein
MAKSPGDLRDQVTSTPRRRADRGAAGARRAVGDGASAVDRADAAVTAFLAEHPGLAEAAREAQLVAARYFPLAAEARLKLRHPLDDDPVLYLYIPFAATVDRDRAWDDAHERLERFDHEWWSVVEERELQMAWMVPSVELV